MAAILNTHELELTIVMPCLNEAETLAICIQTARKLLADSKISGEVLIADNGLTDGSQGIAAVHRLSCHTERCQHVPGPVEWNLTFAAPASSRLAKIMLMQDSTRELVEK